MTTARTALKIVLLWCWLFASIDCGKGDKKPEPSIDLSTVVECVGESWHEDLKSIRPYAPSSVDEYLHAKKGYKAYQTFRHIALRHLISTGPRLLNTLLHYAAKESTKLLLCERDGLGRMYGKVLLKHDENDDSNQELADQRGLDILYHFLLPGPWLTILISIVGSAVRATFSSIPGTMPNLFVSQAERI